METNFVITYTDDIKKYGPIKGIIIGVIKNWCNTNKDKKGYVHEGYTWSGHISIKEFSEQTGLKLDAVATNLKWLVDNGIIIKNNYNKKQFDRTGWYRPNTVIPNIHLGLDPISISGNTQHPFRVIPNIHLGLDPITIPNNLPINQPNNQKLLINATNTGMLGDYEKKKQLREQLVEIFSEEAIKYINKSDKIRLVTDYGQKYYDNYQLIKEYVSITF